MSQPTCACGCGELITHPGATYAGETEADRNKHRARAAYKRKQGQNPVAGTKEALASLGLADDVPVSQLAATLASAAAELSRRVAGVDQAEIERRIEVGLQEARSKADQAEDRASKAQAALVAAGDELQAAVKRADQADEDASKAGEEVERLTNVVTDLETRVKLLTEDVRRARVDQQDAERKADRATAALEELRAGFDRQVAEVRRSVEAETAVKLADQRTTHERELSALREQIVRLESGTTRGRTATKTEGTGVTGRLTGRGKASGNQ
jgi:chromosome segregation ATPase